MSTEKKLDILIVDDDDGHCELIRRNLTRAGVVNHMVTLHSGKEALDYIFRRDNHAGRPADGGLLVLLDIKMPGEKDGIDVLREIKSDPIHHRLPVIMLTTTDDPREISHCYDMGCNAYITKPVEARAFIDTVTRLGVLISLVEVPEEARAT